MKNINEKLLRRDKILLVDDDALFRREFSEAFDEYGVIEASDGQEALAALKKPNEIELVILDIRMSGMNGIEVLSKIRKVNPELRIVISTGYGSKDVAVEALRGQADDYMEKPLDIDSTREIIDNFLGTKRGEPGIGAMDMQARVERVKDFVRRNVLKKVTLKDAAAVVFLSPKYLSRTFKEYAGKGFNDYKLALKMEEAKIFLLKTGYTVEQIAERLGYENSESFIRQFKKITRKTPTEFRKKLRHKTPTAHRRALRPRKIQGKRLRRK